MKALTARQIIRQAYNGEKNIFTPNVIRIGKIDRNTAYEISYGRGMTVERIYGVSIAVCVDGKCSNDHDKQHCFTKLSDAENYVETLKGN